MNLTAERKAAAERRWQARVERTARSALHGAGWTSALAKVEAYVRETWPTLNDSQVEAVLAQAGTMREQQTNGVRRLTPKEIEMAVHRETRETREAIHKLLEQDPTMSVTELWERCRARKVNLTARSSFTNHVTYVRKGMGIDGRKTTTRGLPAVEHATTTEPPARQPSEEVEAAQPPEVDDEQPAPTPPPAVPVASRADTDCVTPGEELRIVENLQSGSTTRESDDDECPKGDPDCMAPDDGEWHCHEACESPSSPNGADPRAVDATVLALQTELLKAQRRVRELKIALEVVEGLVA